MRSWTIAFSLGILLTSLIPALPEGRLPLLLLIPAILSLRLRCLSLSGACCLGICWLLLWAQHAWQALLPSELERQDIWVRGEISSLPETDLRSTRFEMRVARACPHSELATCDFSSELLKNELIQLSLYQELTPIPGQHWQFKVRLKRPHGFQNPGGFDYEAWLWQRGIRASGYVREDSSNRLLQPAGFSLEQFRQSIRDRITETGVQRDLPYAALLRALSIGDRQGLSKADWALFSATGTTHLVVISGMHLGILIGSLYLLLRWLLAWIPGLCLWLPAPRLAALLCLPLAWFYALLAGFALPVQRAFIMAAVFLLSLSLSRHRAVYDAYCLALLLVLLGNPLAGMSPGFWLSFAAVGILLVFLQRPEAGRPLPPPILQLLLELLKSQALIFIGLLPLMMLLFQQSSLLAPLVNLPTIPYITMLVVPLCLVALLILPIYPAGFDFLCQQIDHLLAFFMFSLQFMAGLFPQALLQLPSLSVWQASYILILIGLILFALRSKHFKLSLLLLLVLIPGFIPITRSWPPGQFRLDILDVGQGLAVIISTRDHVLLYDLGPRFGPEFNAGEGIILPFLKARNIPLVDRVVISHADQDHAGGLAPVLAQFPAAEYLSAELDDLPAIPDATLCRSNQQWHWDGVDFKVLHPDAGFYSGNNASCVLLVSNGRFQVVLPGDIDSSIEQTLLQQWPDL